MSVAIQRPSPRVSLRPAVPRDAESLCTWRAEESVRRYQPLNELTVGQLRTDVASHRMSDLYRSRGEKFQWIVQVDEQPSGWITLVVSNWDHGLAEVGYALATEAQGQGVMTSALRLLIEDVFSGTLLERIEARCAVENVASQRVLEKLGFEREGRLRSYFRLPEGRVDNYLFSLLRSDYE